MKSKTNISIVDNAKIRRKSDIIIGKKGEFPSGDILDANATKELVDNVAESVQAITDMAPEDFDTLKEAADAITSLLNSMPTKVSDLENDVPYVTKDETKVDRIDANGHEYVEIAGIKWATMNVGANSITDVGLYFQWGDTQGYTADQVGNGEGKKYFGWEDYKWSDNGSSSTMIKYNVTDGKIVLDLEDDAAHAIMGGTWRMPTEAEFNTLFNATVTRGHDETTGCFTFTENGNTLFLPPTKCYTKGEEYMNSMDSYYWSSSLYRSRNDLAMTLSYRSRNVGHYWRNFGMLVRGVLDTAKVDKYATKEELATVATTGSYNDLENKPAIPNVAVVNLEPEDLNMSTGPYTIINQDKISLICDLIDAKTCVMAIVPNGPNPALGFCTLSPTYTDTNLTSMYLCAGGFLLPPPGGSPFGLVANVALADVTSRYVTSNTGS